MIMDNDFFLKIGLFLNVYRMFQVASDDTELLRKHWVPFQLEPFISIGPEMLLVAKAGVRWWGGRVKAMMGLDTHLSGTIEFNYNPTVDPPFSVKTTMKTVAFESSLSSFVMIHQFDFFVKMIPEFRFKVKGLGNSIQLYFGYYNNLII